MDIRLQPLRVPTGWHVEYNNGLWEIDPNPATVRAADRWWIFKQDMLQMTQARFNRMLDVGWYPEGDLTEGCYKLVIYEGDFKGRLLLEFDTNDRRQLVAEIERVLEAVSSGEL